MSEVKEMPTGVVIVVVLVVVAISLFMMGFRSLEEKGFVVRIVVCR